ncbi:RecX family transcriptional regulator [Candidatus Woesebacteria bacterium]|nr:RecX family transcriptional regulator [Candidatus Woesebacteria bacterium]
MTYSNTKKPKEHPQKNNKPKEETTFLLQNAYFFLRFRERSEQEMHAYLQKKAQKHNIDEWVVNIVLEDLKKNNYINDGRFIESFVSSRLRNKQKSPYVLKYELRKKGISEEDIESFFSSHTIHEGNLIKQLLNKYSYSQRLGKKEQNKIINRLIRRGFRYADIKKTIEEGL